MDAAFNLKWTIPVANSYQSAHQLKAVLVCLLYDPIMEVLIVCLQSILYSMLARHADKEQQEEDRQMYIQAATPGRSSIILDLPQSMDDCLARIKKYYTDNLKPTEREQDWNIQKIQQAFFT